MRPEEGPAALASALLRDPTIVKWMLVLVGSPAVCDAVWRLDPSGRLGYLSMILGASILALLVRHKWSANRMGRAWTRLKRVGFEHLLGIAISLIIGGAAATLIRVIV